MRFKLTTLAAAVAGFSAVSAQAAEAPTLLDPIQTTLTREAEPVSRVPASVSIVSGDELRARGANDLRTALSLVNGVEGTPGGDGGPAGSVPALWGLREVDAFLLVIDGVPAGGAFNPSTVTVDLTGVERIEIVRGAAPVMYGATSFNGVIHVIHYAAGATPAVVSLSGGSYSSAGGSVTSSLPSIGGYKQSLSANIEKRGYKTDREDYSRYHLLYRGASTLDAGRFHVDADFSSVPQTPPSVLLRVGKSLRNDIPIDANHNPADAKLNQKRGHIALGFDSKTGMGEWSTTLAGTRTTDDIVRGFLRGNAPDVSAAASPDGNDADGFTQKRQITDVYFDTHVTMDLTPAANLTYGLDYLYGKGKQNANNYAYFIPLDGSNAPSTENQSPDEIAISSNKRNFAGVYAQTDWRALPEVLDVLVGLRLNRTKETAAGQAIDIAGAGAGDFAASHALTKTRLSGVVGASWYVWKRGNDALTLYTDYRNTYKPLATDFGPEAEVDVLQPETANSYELGLKGRLCDGRLDYDLSGFLLDFKNGLTFDSAGMRANGGKQRFKGGEIETRYALAGDLQVAGNYAYHDSHFVQFVTDDGTDVSGRRLEMAPYYLAGAGLLYTPPRGFNGSVVSNYAGMRKLNKKNSVRAGGYTTVDASFGYQFEKFGVHLNGYNLTDKRVPVAESELQEHVTNHDAPAFDLVASGYYLLPARSVMLNLSMSLD